MAYTSISGKTYSDSEVEKVGGTNYVKNTSISVSPSSSPSGGGGNVSGGGVSPSGGGGGGGGNSKQGSYDRYLTGTGSNVGKKLYWWCR